MGALLGIALGLVAALPLCLQLRRTAPTMAAGMAAVVGAFAFLQVTLLVCHRLAPAELVPFGAMATLAFLAAVVAGIIRRERQ